MEPTCTESFHCLCRDNWAHAQIDSTVYKAAMITTPADSASFVSDPRGALTALIELTKPGVTRLVIFTTALGAVMAPGVPALQPLLLTVVGTLLVVGSANALNMYLEHDVDALMERTRNRPLPSGRVSGALALSFGLLLGIGGVAVLGAWVTPLSGELAMIALVTYVLIYTPMKALSPLSLYVGAIPGAMPPLLGYAGLYGELTLQAWSVFAVLFVWQIPHFLAIAVFRQKEYARAGLQVMTVVQGLAATRTAIWWSSVALVATTFLPCVAGLGGVIYGVVAALSGAVFLVWARRGNTSQDTHAWARRLFFASMPHLSLLFLVLALTAP